LTPEIPEPQRQSGSRRLFHNLELVVEAGAQATVVSENLGSAQDQLRLQQLGIPVFPTLDLGDLLENQAFDVAIAAFWYFAEKCIPLLRERAPDLPIVVDAVDLEFVRTARELFGNSSKGSSGALDPSYGQKMHRELNVYARADRVLTVSEKERETVSDLVNDRVLAACVPDYEEYPESQVPLEQRRGILFVGNFRHPPNGEALEFLCWEIAPALDRAGIAKDGIQVVGNALDGSLLDLCRSTPGVEPIGFVPSLVPYFAQARTFVAPLLSGAGTKRKLIQALMVGVPIVATSIAVEGLEINDGEGVLIADDREAFAREIGRLLESDSTWRQVAGRGRELILRGHGREAVKARLLEAVEPLLNETGGQGSAQGDPGNLMKRDWDRRARSNAMHYIASARSDWTSDDFFASGRANVEETITRELEQVCRGKKASEMRILEIGCGIGRMTRHLAALFGEVHAVDVSGEMIRQAGEHLRDVPNVRLYETSGADLAPFEDQFFDFAYSFIVFQHVPDKETIISNLREVHRTLKPDCLFKFQVQGRELEETDTWKGAGFTGEEMASLAAEIGFEPLASSGEGTQYFWNWWQRGP
jgi:SAM-dependent methyltransferase/glycosyltransferase involved in cell wall biosynthesis